MTETQRSLTNSPSAPAAAVLATACALVLSLASGRAAAEGARVVDADRKVESTAFAADPATGRAWIDVVVARRFASGKEARAAGTRVPVLVSELAYEESTQELVHLDGPTRTTCATLAGDAVVATGACRIVATIEARAVDTGFGNAVRAHLVVRVMRER